MQRTLIVIALLLLAAITVPAVLQHGYLGIITSHFPSFAGMQVLTGLVIALTLVMIWIWHDAKATGRNPWPWIVATLAMGSFGPLAYLLTRKGKASSA